MVRNDDRLDFDWGNGSPDSLIPADRFSVRWTRSIDLEAGVYRFDLVVDDGVRFYVDGTLVLDKIVEANNAAIHRAVEPGQRAARLPHRLCGIYRDARASRGRGTLVSG